MDSVAAVRAARHDLPQEDDLVAVLLHRNVVVVDAAPGLGEFGQLVVVRRKLRAAAAGGIVVQELRDRPGDRKPVERARAAADLVENDQALRRHMVQDVRGFDHLDHEGALAARQVVGRADARENPVDQPELHRLGRNERSHLREHHQQRSLPDVGRFAGHVRPGDQHHAVAVAVEQTVVRHEFLAAGHRGVEHRVPPALDDQPVVLENAGPVVVVKPGTFGQAQQCVDVGERVGGVLDAARETEREFAQFLKKLVFERAGLFLGAEDFAFQLFQFRGDEPLGVHEGLLADVILRHGGEIGFADLDIVAEY